MPDLQNSNCGTAKSWVKSPRVEKGGYCRSRRGSDEHPSMQGNAFLKSAAILLGGAVAGGAIGVFASRWATKSGVEKQVKEAQDGAAKKVEQEVSKIHNELKSEMAARLSKAEADSKAATDNAVKATQEESGRSTAAAISKVRSEMQSEMDLKVAGASDEARSQVETEYKAKAAKAVEVHKREADMDLAVRRQALEAEMNTRLQQRETEISQQVNSAAIAQVATERSKAMEEAAAAIRKAADPKARRQGDLIDDDNTGVALSASVRQGLDLNVITPERMQARVGDAVKRMTARKLEQGLESLNSSFKSKVKDAVSDPKTSASKGWLKIKNVLAAQNTREAAFEVGLDDIRKDISTKYKDALSDLHSNAAEGGYNDEALGRFDKKSKKLNDEMQKSVSALLNEVTNLKTRWDSTYRRSLQSYLSKTEYL